MRQLMMTLLVLLGCAGTAHAELRVFPANGVPIDGFVFVEAGENDTGCSDWIGDVMDRLEIVGTAADEGALPGTLQWLRGDFYRWSPGAIMSPQTDYTLVFKDPSGRCSDFTGVGEQHTFRTSRDKGTDAGLEGTSLSLNGGGDCVESGDGNQFQFDVTVQTTDVYVEVGGEAPFEPGAGQRAFFGLTQAGECTTVPLRHMITGRESSREICAPDTQAAADNVSECEESEEGVACAAGGPGGALPVALVLGLVFVALRRRLALGR